MTIAYIKHARFGTRNGRALLPPRHLSGDHAAHFSLGSWDSGLGVHRKRLKDGWVGEVGTDLSPMGWQLGGRMTRRFRLPYSILLSWRHECE